MTGEPLFSLAALGWGKPFGVQAREREKQRIKTLCKAADRFRPRG